MDEYYRLHSLNHSGSIAALSAALAVVQSELKNPSCDRANSHFKNRYATLQQLTDHTRPVLAKHGLSVMQLLFSDDPKSITVKTMLLHKSGEYIVSHISSERGPNIQSAGAVVTYMRRYALSALLGIAGDDDDDAESLVAPTREKAKKTAPVAEPASLPPDFRWYSIMAVEAKQGKAKPFWTVQMHDVDMGNDITATTFSATIGERLRASIGTRVQIRVSEKAKDGRTWCNIEDAI
jgi:hypothetical protein